MGLYKKLGFEESQFFSKFILSFSFLRSRSDDLNYSDDIYFFEKFLSNNDRLVLKDHISTDTKKLFIYFNKDINNNIFIIVKKKTKKLIFPILEIIYVSDLKKFSSYEKIIGYELLRRFKPILFKFNNTERDEIFSNNFFLKRIVKKKVYYLNKPLNFQFDILYSELLR